MRKLALPFLSIALAAGLLACGGNDAPPPFTAAVFGDVPYGTGPTDTSELAVFPAFIKSINDDPSVSLALHGGDIHSGKEYCTQAWDQNIFNIMKTLTMPVVYTPGDNEWADCHKLGEGGGKYNATTGAIDFARDASGNQIGFAGGNPVDNLALVRSIFFPSAGKTFGGAMDVHSQAKEFDPAFPADAQYIENVWFMKSGILFVAANIPGGSNNGTDPWYGAPSQSAAQTAEVASRSGAALRWLKTAFDQASANGATAVVILEQADMWDADGVATTHITGYKQYIDLIAARTSSFGKPVLLLNGDSHIYRSDNPLQPGAPCAYEPTSGAGAVACTFDSYNNQPGGYNVSNFHRVVYHGSTTPLEWLKLKVDPAANVAASANAFGPFSWLRVMK